MTYVNLHLSVPYSQLMHGYLNHHKSDLNTSVLDFVYRSLQIFCQLRGRTIKGTNNCIIVLANMNIYVHTFQLYSKIYFWGVRRVLDYTTTIIVSVFSVRKIFVEIFINVNTPLIIDIQTICLQLGLRWGIAKLITIFFRQHAIAIPGRSFSSYFSC